MAGKFARSWALMKASAEVLRSDKSLLMFPLMSGICTLLVAATFLIPIAMSIVSDAHMPEYVGAHHHSPIYYVVMFAFYLVQYAVIIFFNTALASVALQRLRGEEASVADGIAVAKSRLGTIIGYALIAATVGLLLRTLQERMGLIGRFVVGLLGLAWTVATFLVVPVLASEEVGPVDAVQRSTELLRRTWGENLIGNAGIGVIFGLIMFVAVLLSALLIIGAAGTHSVVAMVTIAAVLVVAFTLLGLIQSSLQGIYAAALYRYAEDGEAGGPFDQLLLEQAFRPKA
jgi:hypothetical protein